MRWCPGRVRGCISCVRPVWIWLLVGIEQATLWTRSGEDSWGGQFLLEGYVGVPGEGSQAGGNPEL